jgi:pimeloyl-ACP methyl ester carboxylesterase
VSEPRAAGVGLLDTRTVILLPRIIDPGVLSDEPTISTITLAELSVGPLVARTDAERAARQAHVQQAEADFDTIPFDAAAARTFGRVAADGFLFLDSDKFAGSFAPDLSPNDAAFMADSQVPWGLDALNGAISEPAWRAKPSWYLVATEDRMIPPPAQRAMSERIGATTAEVAASHAVYVSQPDAVVDLISKAVAFVAAPSR